MKISDIHFYRCPADKSEFVLLSPGETEGDIKSGTLKSATGNCYEIKDGIPDFTQSAEDPRNEYAIKLFREKAKEYDKYQHLSFDTFYCNETDTRNSIIDRMNLKGNENVLEVNAGTGRDSELILKRLNQNGRLFVQDISIDMLEVLTEKLQHKSASLAVNRSNALKLPFQDGFFDAVYSFGGVGMNVYSDNKDALAEIVRVTKPGGRVVIGGLSLAPWLLHTEFAKILINNNYHYANEICFEDIPQSADKLNVQWIMSGAGFVLDFTVNPDAMKANFDYEIPGMRGGTLRTRYYGNLEGVSRETKELAQKAREVLNISMHDWLDNLVRKEALEVLKGKEK